ncbi:unnamed protein product [Blepharisma stoltei]|uniref:PX domain-containing protein n=1 Tax=Blepharisma stoltei TaxID=1481888 RepID=A0AAU9JK24_9CILI|nr:unnamed protein product [Blepharisma stoltei]
MEISIPNFREVKEGPKTYIIYTIEVAFGGWQNTLEKRYSELLELHQVMKLMRRVLSAPLPHFPGQLIWKQVFKKLKPEEVTKRKEDLERYLQELSRTDCATNSQYFMEFIGMPQRVRSEWIIGTH